MAVDDSKLGGPDCSALTTQQPTMRHAAESAANVVVGYVINLVLVYVLMHWLGYAIQLHESASMGAVFAVVAFVRGYSIRRLFHRFAQKKPASL